MNSDGKQPLRVAFLTNIISPYRRPMLQALAATPGWQLHVVVNAKTEFDRDWHGDCEGVAVSQPRTWSFRRTRTSSGTAQVVTLHVPIGLWRELSRLDPDVVITHELGVRSYLAAQWARCHQTPLVVWSYQAKASAIPGGRLRRHVRQTILHRAAAVVGMGRQARAVLEDYGVPATKILDAPNATDVNLLQTRLQAVRSDGTARALRQRLGNGKRICLVAGRLEPVKHIAGTLSMWQQLPQTLRDQWQLVFVGNGSLQHLIAASDDPSIRHEPAVTMAEMAGYYAASDLHLFASLADVWGLVVNESMLAGIPTLCSTLAGCAEDLIQDGQNGVLFDPRDAARAAQVLQQTLRRDDLAALGHAARQTGSTFTVDRLAGSFRQAVARALTKHAAGAPTATLASQDSGTRQRT